MKKAEADYLRAVNLARILKNDHDGVCFHCQQAAEKYLKALLEESGHGVPRTHILRDLAGLLLPQYPGLRPLQRGLKFLTRFAVGIRYPGEDATKRQSTAALRWAVRVRTKARSLLGLPASASKRKKRR